MSLEKNLAALEEILDIEYEKLYYYRKKIAQGLSAPEEFRLKHLIKTESKPNIQRCEKEYWSWVAQAANSSPISETEMSSAIVQVVQEVEHIQNTRRDMYPDELIRLLTEIRKKLDERGTPASAKLRVAVPLIPSIVSYELEMDTEASLRSAWLPIKRLFRGTPDEKKK